MNIITNHSAQHLDQCQLTEQALKPVHPSWLPLVTNSLAKVDTKYLSPLEQHSNWLPGPNDLLNAFSIPLEKTRYLLLGESPYPRVQSANGYAFWDGAVHEIWSPSGLTKPVNRATSLRHLIKMLLVADGALTQDTSQARIASLDKSRFVTTLDELFQNMLADGFLLLNASLVLNDQPVRYHARAWQPFMIHLLNQLGLLKPDLQLILFGKIAQYIQQLSIPTFPTLQAEHPYNISFIHNQDVLNFFHPLSLLTNKLTK